MSGSRRELLKRGLALIGGAVGMGALGKSAAKLASGSPSLKLRATDLRLVADGGFPRPGGRYLVTAELLEASGRKVGALYGTHLGVESSGRVGLSGVVGMELHSLVLEDGTLQGSGTVSRSLDAPDTFAIVGGTGIYTGASGSYTALQRHLGLGGDGTGEFEITITSEEAPHGR